MVRATRTSTAGTRRSASAVPVTSPVQSSPKRRRKTIPSPPPEESDDEDEASDTSIMTAVTTKSTSTATSRAPSRRTTLRGAGSSRPSSTRQSTAARRTTRNALEPQSETPSTRTSSSRRNKLTPAPSEATTRSVTPSVGKIDPATPVKHEQESPKGNSDKENQVPLLAVPSLLGSVKKGSQQLTPPPEYISPRKLDIARLTAAETSTVQEGPRNRIVITHLVLNNFKSYAGRQIIGPFHTVSSFTLYGINL
jgi:structural maintenance of chromosome 4